jgi:hypothetical protein
MLQANAHIYTKISLYIQYELYIYIYKYYIYRLLNYWFIRL